MVCESLVDFTAELNFWMCCSDCASLFKNVACVWTCDRLCSNCARFFGAGMAIWCVVDGASDRDLEVCRLDSLVGANRARTAIKPQKEKKTFIVVGEFLKIQILIIDLNIRRVFIGNKDSK